MKKILVILMLVAGLALTACGENTTTYSELNSKSDIESETSDDTIQDEENKSETNDESTQSNNGEIDLDLSDLNNNMAYAEIYSIMMMPDDYIGKTIKVEGDFSIYYEASTGVTYYGVVVTDSSACCAAGFELEFSDENLLESEDFPKSGERVTVIGTFETYDYYGQPNGILRNSYFL